MENKDDNFLSFRINSKWSEIHDEIGTGEYLLMLSESGEFMDKLQKRVNKTLKEERELKK